MVEMILSLELRKTHKIVWS